MSEPNSDLINKLNSTILPGVDMENTRMKDAAAYLTAMIAEKDPSGNGIKVQLSDKVQESNVILQLHLGKANMLQAIKSICLATGLMYELRKDSVVFVKANELSMNPPEGVDLNLGAPSAEFYGKLNRITLEVSMYNAPLIIVVNYLSSKMLELDLGGKGAGIIYCTSIYNMPVVSMDSMGKKISLLQAIQDMAKSANVDYQIGSDFVLITSKTALGPTEARSFDVVFEGLDIDDPSLIKIILSPYVLFPEGTGLTYNKNSGILTLTHTRDTLDRMEKILDELSEKSIDQPKNAQ